MTEEQKQPEGAPSETDAQASTSPVSEARRVHPVVRVMFWVLLLLSISASLWWSLYFPYDREQLYRAIPSGATYVSEHIQLADRWPSLAQNPILRNMLASVAEESDGPQQAIDDPNIQLLMDRLAGKNTVVAYVPTLGDGGAPAWVLASWCGGYGQVIKWGTFRQRSADFKSVDVGHGRKVWSVQSGDAKSDDVLSIALVEGILLMCLSRDPAGVRHLVDRLENTAPLAAEFRDKLAMEEAGVTVHEAFEESPDRGWVRMGDPDRYRADERHVRFALTGFNDKGLTGWAGMDSRKLTPRARPPGAGATNRITVAVLDPVQSILGSSPAALVVAPFHDIAPSVFAKNSNREWRKLGFLLRNSANTNAPVFLSVCKAEYSGKILGYRASTIIVGMPLRDPALFENLVKSIIDCTNAGFDLGLIPKTVESRGRKLIVVEGVNSDAFLRLGSEERPTFTLWNDWLVFSSNRWALEQLMASWRGERRATTTWRHDILEREATVALWFDLAATHDVLVKIVAIYDLWSYMPDTKADPGLRKNLGALKVWLDGIRDLETCTLWSDLTPQGPNTHFRIGRGR